MDNWNEIRTAAAVARHGSIADAAKALGVHRATVVRHVEHLEQVFAVKLFQRHNRGMTPTPLGARLLQVADAANVQFGELRREAMQMSEELTGDFTVTSVDILAPLVMPLLAGFRKRHPKLRLRYIASDQMLRLAYGEADIAFRIGHKPAAPDNVPMPFQKIEMGVYGHKAIIDSLPESLLETEPDRADWIGPDANTPEAPFVRWLRKTVPEQSYVLRSQSIFAMWQAVQSGAGIGFLPTYLACSRPELRQVIAPREEWNEQVWAVAHIDLNRSAKVGAFRAFLNAQ